MGGFSNFAISFSIISILTGAVTLYGHGLKMGGPAEMALGWPLVTLFTLAVVASMAELASRFRPPARCITGLGARRQGLGLVHRLVQHHRADRGHRGHRLRLRAFRHAAAGLEATSRTC